MASRGLYKQSAASVLLPGSQRLEAYGRDTNREAGVRSELKTAATEVFAEAASLLKDMDATPRQALALLPRLEKAVANFFGEYQPHLLRGLIRRLARLPAAVEDFDAALRARPQDRLARLHRNAAVLSGGIKFPYKRREQAKQDTLEYLKDHDSDRFALLIQAAAQCLFGVGDKSLSKPLIDILTINPSDCDVLSLLCAGSFHDTYLPGYEQEGKARVLDYASRTLAIDPDNLLAKSTIYWTHYIDQIRPGPSDKTFLPHTELEVRHFWSWPPVRQDQKLKDFNVHQVGV